MTAERTEAEPARATTKRVKMTDVAAAAGVSRATVSLVMTQSPLVAARTRDHVLQVAEELGYVYNRHAAGFRSQHSRIVGLVVTDLRNPFFGEIATTIQHDLAAQEYFLVVADTADDPEQQRRAVQQMQELNADGMLLVPASGTDPGEVAGWNERIPVVLLTRDLEAAGVSYVGSEDYEGGQTAARHLIEVHGCRTLGYFGSAVPGSASERRLAGFRDAAEAAGVAVQPQWLGDGRVHATEAYDAFLDLLDRGAPPEGLVCNSDNVAFGAMRALRDSGHTSVADCRVIGFDDVEQAAMWSPSLTSVAVSRKELGASAARTILAAVGGERAEPVRIRHASQLRVRESCGCGSPTGP